MVDWHAQKDHLPFFWGTINCHLTKINENYWNITPSHTNIVESAHAYWNRETNVGGGILTAINE